MDQYTDGDRGICKDVSAPTTSGKVSGQHSPVSSPSTPYKHLFVGNVMFPNCINPQPASQVKHIPSPTPKTLLPKPTTPVKRYIPPFIATPKKKQQLDRMSPNCVTSDDFYNHAYPVYPAVYPGSELPIATSPDSYQTAYDSIDCQNNPSISDGDSDYQRRSVPSSKPASRPFPRKSKAGHQHYVTPSSATTGFICTFNGPADGQTCRKEFDLPSKIREHLIDEHMRFSPFQCSHCKKIFTRLSIHTRHLSKSRGSEGRVCKNPKAEGDDNYRIRKSVKDALWEIRLRQQEVEKAVSLIMTYNGRLEERRRRGVHGNSPGHSPERSTRAPSSRHSPYQTAIHPSQNSHFSRPQQSQKVYVATPAPYDASFIPMQRSFLPNPPTTGFQHAYYQSQPHSSAEESWESNVPHTANNWVEPMETTGLTYPTPTSMPPSTDADYY